MTTKKQKDFHPLSCAMGDWMRACLSFPLYGDIAWKIRHPDKKDPKDLKKKAA